ncbi:MAG: ComEC/Rec2 family competence protein [Pseudomonadota bacterium]
MTTAQSHRNPSREDDLAAGLGDRWTHLLARERRRLPLWAPVLIGLGVWVFFSLHVEPSAWWIAAAMAAPASVLAGMSVRGIRRVPLPLVAAALALSGFSAAAVRTAMVAGPVAPPGMDGTVEGRVADISRTSTDRRRVLIADPVIFGMAREETPRRVRVTLLEGDFARTIAVGDRISVFARLNPPAEPVEPGGFDFRRHAWFDGLGAIGYATGPAVAASLPPEAETWAGRVARWRGALADGIREAAPGPQGAFAAAILVGSRAEIRREELQALRDSNLAHLLAISGLHMGLLVGLVFAVVRLALAATPSGVLHLPSKKVAAGFALLAAAAYLVLSGASVATQRAFVMAAAALLAVMLDRPAISLRALAAAAAVILLLRPEGLVSAGFQMSFAATVALVAVYERARSFEAPRWQARGLGARVAVVAGGLLLTSLVAGLATAPFAAASFNRATTYGLAANLAAVPIMSFWVMPMGAAAALLAPIGLAAAPLAAMGWGISAILSIAEVVASWPGAVRPVASPPPGAMALIALGGLWTALWATRMRWFGVGGVAAGMALWIAASDRPEVLIAPRGAAIGALGEQGRAVDRPRGGSFAVRSWLENDGDPATQDDAALRPGLERDGRISFAELENGWQIVLLRGRVAARALEAYCEPRVLIIAPMADRRTAQLPCRVLHGEDLARLGALAIDPAEDDIAIRGAVVATSRRRWGAAATIAAEAQ